MKTYLSIFSASCLTISVMNVKGLPYPSIAETGNSEASPYQQDINCAIILEYINHVS